MGFCYILKHKYNQHPIYVGSTEDLQPREQHHRSACNNINIYEHYNLSVYKHIRKHSGIDHWEMIKTYEGPDFKIFEKNYIKSTWLYNLNENIPLRTEQETKDIKIAYKKDNINRRKERIACPNCGSLVNKGNVTHHMKTLKCIKKSD